MHLRHLFSSRLRGSLLLGSLLVVSSFSTQAAEEMLRKAVGKGAYEMAYSQQENALWLATSQSRKLDKGGVVYRLDPVTLEVTQAIHNDLKPFGATINNTTQTLWFGNTVNSAVTAIDAKTGEVKGRLVLDDRKRTEEVRPLQPRELVADDATNTVYISGIGKESVIWVVDGGNIKLKTAIQNTGKMSTGLALDSEGKRLYTTNADGELITIDTADNKILSRKKLLDDWLGSFLLFSGFLFHTDIQRFAIGRQRQAVWMSRRIERFHHFIAFRVNHTDFTCLTMRYVGFITRGVKQHSQ